ncbi:Abi family protein [Lacticaseibacillus paracasei]|uniref:Abi family protein n=1 Tax=Lacticaseibacillus paracasei TaxID=1597 RepID=UPI0021A32F01|nr:Abi family protein [Lacticaseibacillus paracasei]MCT3344637.1 Abi family protein [Lacticaseibacillus paracasei]
MSDSAYSSYKQLIEILRNNKHRVIIPSGSEEYVKEVLSSRSYYGLINAFKEFLLTSSDVDVNFDQFVFSFQIETDLRSSLLKFTLLFETRFKETLAHMIGEKYGVNAEQYLQPVNFGKAAIGRVQGELNYYRRKAGIQTLPNASQKNWVAKIKDNPTKYYRERKNIIPPWILIRNLTLGESIVLYKILKSIDKMTIINRMLYRNETDAISENDSQGFAESLSIISDFRNQLAHGSRIGMYHSAHGTMNKNIEVIITGGDFLQDSQQRYHEDDLFCFESLLVRLLSKIDKPGLINELTSIEYKYDAKSKYLYSYKSMVELPSDYIERLHLLAGIV